MTDTIRRTARGVAAVSALALMAACTDGVDLDMRGAFNQFNTAEAARMATLDRPRPDDRGIISYPNYQVAVARNGDTVRSMAARIGADADQLARHNGLNPDTQLRQGEVVSLPNRVAEPTAATGAAGTDITSIAGGAIDRAGDRRVETTTLAPAAASATAPAASPAVARTEPDRHKVVRGETAYTVARLYNVSVTSLAEWNGLDGNYTIREGQYLMIPVAAASAPATVVPAAASATATASSATTAPGQGSPTPTPPSAAKPLPAEKTVPLATQTAAAAKPAKPVADVGKETAKAAAQMAYPVKGNIVREYAKGKNDGIDISAAPGTAIGAASGGEVAAITSDADNNHVIVVRHEGKLLTIYSNVTKIAVKEKQKVSRGQKLAEVPGGSSAYVHFEVRKGLESTDPLPYLR
ncbi:peptidase M23B [Oceanicola sp. 22II-s10i]|uniref:peptidoglycan DD-metalloendopeptidase family protein n=1 Tax=Oceanicola sp. 22II-s10i TaxID=1317116 RepID=UPI000B5256EE|nr:peptidoglycan DD-metalloendopeptidase family protein [Oceanicola sp. 22II-s10i]OWU84739.1 peptidase M23B [Oceanicola sp. 22II-s10i]